MTSSSRWRFVSDLHLDADDRRSANTAAAFRRFVDAVVLAHPTRADHLVLLGDTFELRRARQAPLRTAETALAAACRALPDAIGALRDCLGAGVNLHLVCGNHDYPLLGRGCRQVLQEELEASPTHAASVQPWLLHEPGVFYAEHGHQHHDLNRIPLQLLAAEASPGDRLPPTVLESWDLLRGAGSLARMRALAEAIRAASRAERTAGHDDYGRLLAAAAGDLDVATARALQDVSRFAVLRAVARTGRRVLARRIGSGDHDGYLRAAAARVDAILDRRGAPRPLCYVFGHTHLAALDALPRRGAWYANTGTWSDQVHGTRDARGLPFLLVEGGGAGAPVTAHLQLWNPESRRAVVARTVEG